MRKMPEIKAENGFVTSIDGNAIPTTKLYAHSITFSDTQTDKRYVYLVDNNPQSYKEFNIQAKYATLTIPCFGFKIQNGITYQYLEFSSIGHNMYSFRYGRANLETNKIDTYSDTVMGIIILSDVVTPLN